MTPEGIERFLDNIKLRAQDLYIDLDEEKGIMQEAVDSGVPSIPPNPFLRQACAIESEVKKVVSVMLEQFCVNHGEIDLDEY